MWLEAAVVGECLTFSKIKCIWKEWFFYSIRNIYKNKAKSSCEIILCTWVDDANRAFDIT